MSQNKTMLITGCSSGLGKALALQAMQAGYRVLATARKKTHQDELRALGLEAYELDVCDAASIQQLVLHLHQQNIQLDILVNNAGIYGPQDFYATDDATWDNYWQTNVMSGVRLSRGLLPAMVSKGWGRVVFISSESARNIPADMIHYGVTKTAQLSLARGLAKYVAGSGVTVNSVLPGPTISDGFAEMLKDEVAKTGQSLEELAKAFVMTHRPSSVIQRAASVEEVANMVVYVCSPQASATSGAALRVDGGVVDDIL